MNQSVVYFVIRPNRKSQESLFENIPTVFICVNINTVLDTL